ncbi:unnamed protein product [Leuciscus chuanchicus]
MQPGKTAGIIAPCIISFTVLDIWPTSDNSLDSERWSLHVKHNPSLEGPRRAWAYFKDKEAQGRALPTHTRTHTHAVAAVRQSSLYEVQSRAVDGQRSSREVLTSTGYAPGKQLACLTAPGPDCLVNPQQNAQKAPTCPASGQPSVHEAPLSSWMPRPPLALKGTGWLPHCGFWCLVTGSEERGIWLTGESEETLST